jgi:translocation and assembly module TamA
MSTRLGVQGTATWLGALLILACQHVRPAPDARSVDSLRIEGTKALSQREIEGKLATVASSALPIVGRTEWFDASAWQADLRRIVRIYESKGYYQARIVEQHVDESVPGAVRLSVRVSEGNPARVASVTVSGLQTLEAPLARRIEEELPFKSGDIFLEESWVAAKAAIGRKLKEGGYADADVSGTAAVDAANEKVAIELKVVSGIRYRFGQLYAPAVPGAVVPPRLLVAQVDGEIQPGDWFTESALESAQRRLSQMGVFSVVKVTPGATEPDTGTVPVIVDVREAPMRSVRGGFGFGGDLIRQEVRLLGEYTNRNLGFSRLFNKSARLDRLTLKGKVGWAFLPTIWTVFSNSSTSQNGLFGRLQLEYEVPRFWGFRTLSLETSVEALRTLDLAFDYWGAEYKLGLLWKPRPDFIVFPSVNFNAYGLNTDIPLFSAAPSAALGCPRLPLLCVVSFADLQIEWDRRDNKLEPTQGTYASVSIQAGVSRGESLEPYWRIVPELRGYRSFFGDRLTLAGKVRLGTLVAGTTNTPVVARFFSGGALMRGFNQRRLSPLVAFAPDMTEADFVRRFGQQGADTSSVETRDRARQAVQQCSQSRRTDNAQAECQRYEDGVALPVGGNGLAEASFEVRFRVFSDFVLAAFADVGLVTEAPLGVGTNWGQSLYVAVGLGARYRLPIGPLRLDLGFRLPSIGGPQQLSQLGAIPVNVVPSNGCLFSGPSQGSYAGAPENWCSIHLSIGEAF